MAEGNKFITSRSAIQNPFPKYRSVKYRVELSALQKLGKSAYQSDVVTRPSNPERPSWRKPSSYSQHRRANSSATNCVMAEESSQEMKMSYLSTWDRLLSAPDKSQLMESRAVEVMRVHLPSIVSFEPSKFTVLDPLFLPIEDIERGIDEVSGALPPDKVAMGDIHQQMLDFEMKISNELDQCQREGMQALRRFKEMLRTDRVEHQAQNMRLKRQAASLTLEYQQFRSNFEQTKGRLDIIQMDIFSSRPFDLAHQPDYEEQFPQPYF